MSEDRKADGTGDPAAVADRVGEIWRDVLGEAGSDSGKTFLELGGQSISAIRIVTRVLDEIGVDVDVETLFDDPDLTGFIDSVLSAAGRA